MTDAGLTQIANTATRFIAGVLPRSVRSNALYADLQTAEARKAAHKVGTDVTWSTVETHSSAAKKDYESMVKLINEFDASQGLNLPKSYKSETHNPDSHNNIHQWIGQQRASLGERTDANKERHTKLDNLESNFSKFKDSHFSAEWSKNFMETNAPRGGMFNGIQNTALRRSAKLATFTVAAGLVLGGIKAIYNMFNNSTGGSTTQSTISEEAKNALRKEGAMMVVAKLQEAQAAQAQSGGMKNTGNFSGQTIDATAQPA